MLLISDDGFASRRLHQYRLRDVGRVGMSSGKNQKSRNETWNRTEVERGDLPIGAGVQEISSTQTGKNRADWPHDGDQRAPVARMAVGKLPPTK